MASYTTVAAGAVECWAVFPCHGFVWEVGGFPAFFAGGGCLTFSLGPFCLAYWDFLAADLDGTGGGIGLGDPIWRCNVDWSVVSRLA